MSSPCPLLPCSRSQPTSFASDCRPKAQLNSKLPGWRQSHTILLLISTELFQDRLPLLTECLKVKVILRPTVSRLVHIGVRHPSGTRDQFYFLLEIFFRQLRVCYFVALSLRRGRVCNLLFCWSSPALSRSGLSSTGLETMFYCSNSWDSPSLEGQVPQVVLLIISRHVPSRKHISNSLIACVTIAAINLQRTLFSGPIT
jgi:hypothetical protein